MNAHFKENMRKICELLNGMQFTCLFFFCLGCYAFLRSHGYCFPVAMVNMGSSDTERNLMSFSPFGKVKVKIFDNEPEMFFKKLI